MTNNVEPKYDAESMQAVIVPDARAQLRIFMFVTLFTGRAPSAWTKVMIPVLILDWRGEGRQCVGMAGSRQVLWSAKPQGSAAARCGCTL